MSARLEELKEKYGVGRAYEILPHIDIYCTSSDGIYHLRFKGWYVSAFAHCWVGGAHSAIYSSEADLLSAVHKAIKSGSKLEVDKSNTWDFTNLEVFR